MRRRVLLLVGATTSLVLVAFLVPLAILVRDVAADRAVQAATTQAQALSSLIATTDRDSLEVSVTQADQASEHDLTVFLGDGTRLGHAAPRSPLVRLASRGTSASADVSGGREIVFAVREGSGRNAVIRAFVPDDQLRAGVDRAWLLLTGLGVTLLVVSLLVADRMARRLVRSTIALADVSHRLSSGDLSARTDPESPAEIGVVARSLNHLGSRIDELLSEERETVADLSHRVRTPLTALRLEAEALTNPEEAERISDGVDAVQRAVTQVIAQARRRSTEPVSGCDAAEVVRERVEFWAALAEDTGRTPRCEIAPGPLQVQPSRGDLAASLDALLGNVFAHTPDGTDFSVRLEARPGGGAVLWVEDDGPGLPESSLAHRGASASGSSGLGLDIARRTARRGGGSLTLGRSPSGGLSVRMELAGVP